MFEGIVLLEWVGGNDDPPIPFVSGRVSNEIPAEVIREGGVLQSWAVDDG